MELGAVPVGHTGHDDALDVGHHVLPALGLLGGLRRNQRAQVARLDLRKNASAKKENVVTS